VIRNIGYNTIFCLSKIVLINILCLNHIRKILVRYIIRAFKEPRS